MPKPRPASTAAWASAIASGSDPLKRSTIDRQQDMSVNTIGDPARRARSIS